MMLSKALFSALAFAATPCPDFSEFAGKGIQINVCEDNAPLGFEAMRCAELFREQVEEAKRSVNSLIAAEAAKQASQQTDSLQRASSGYDKAGGLLKQLRADGFETFQVLHRYHVNMAFPEDYDEPEVTGMSTEAYLKGQECFHVPQSAIRSSKSLVKKIMKDLLALRRSLLAKTQSLDSRNTRLEGKSGPGAAKTFGQGSKQGTVVPKQGPSDVSGTNRAIEDRKKGQKIIEKQLKP